MKNMPYLLAAIAAVVLILAALGKLIGDPHVAFGFAVQNVVLAANTLLSLAILCKLFEKK